MTPAEELFAAAEKLRKRTFTGYHEADGIDFDLALADTLEMMGRTFQETGGPAPEHQEAFPIFRVARLLNAE